jgi:tetratricopeptide (TPR) repeat protein
MAIESCSRIINDPGSSNEVRDPALRNRGWLLQSKGDLEGAIADYTAVLKLSPAEHKLNARTYVNRGVAYANKGDDKSALADYDQAVMLDPSVGSAYLNAPWPISMRHCGLNPKRPARISIAAFCTLTAPTLSTPWPTFPPPSP